MQPTTVSTFDGRESIALGGQPPVDRDGLDALSSRYKAIMGETRLSWLEHHRLVRRLGSGGQGIVYLCERRGADNFTLPLALKIFSPERYESPEAYDIGMARMAQVALRIALIQQDNLIDVNNFVSLNRIRIMEMEWVDGYDLQNLLTDGMLQRARDRVGDDRWEYLNDVIVTAGPVQPRLKPGVAIAVLRDILAALSALHREGIIHGDIKPSNIMLKRTGNAKLVDIGSAYECAPGARPRTCTPTYAAPEILDGADGSPRSDLASLGYVLVEMLSGDPPFTSAKDTTELLELADAKHTILDRIPSLLPDDVLCNEHLMSLIHGLIDPDPARRFASAEEADLVERGAANFHRQLVRGNLASEYDNEIRVWLEELE